jgi:Fic family protein
METHTLFYLNPDFSITNQEIIDKYKIENLNLISNDSLRRGMESKLRYEVYNDKFGLSSKLENIFMIQILAESHFWIEDIETCYELMMNIKEKIIIEDLKLNKIIINLEKIIEDSIIKDEEYFNNEGEDKIEEAILHTYKIPLKNPFLETDYETLKILNEKWKSLKLEYNEYKTNEEFSRYACVSTNELEGIFELNGKSWLKLIKRGFFTNSIEGISKTSKEKKKSTIVKILINTSECINLIGNILDDYLKFDENFLNLLHTILLKNNNFEEIDSEMDNIKYYRLIKSGEFRKVACRTFHEIDDIIHIIQFCHHSNIKSEMSEFCKEVRKLLLDDELDPFLKSAYIQHKFLFCHPYEDVNGRISRIISSIPLVKIGLPPIVVTNFQKKKYFEAIRFADNGDIFPLRNFLILSYFDGFDEIEKLNKN